jgi:NAD-dependent deacetylase
VLDFYNQRRRQLKEVEPNLGHHVLADLENDFSTYITQNVDDLHERAGSNVLHLHGELKSTFSSRLQTIIDWKEDLVLGDVDAQNRQLRPYIVWFGEEVPALEEAAVALLQPLIFLQYWYFLQVYPAAGLIDFTPAKCPFTILIQSQSRFRI